MNGILQQLADLDYKSKETLCTAVVNQRKAKNFLGISIQRQTPSSNLRSTSATDSRTTASSITKPTSSTTQSTGSNPLSTNSKDTRYRKSSKETRTVLTSSPIPDSPPELRPALSDRNEIDVVIKATDASPYKDRDYLCRRSMGLDNNTDKIEVTLIPGTYNVRLKNKRTGSIDVRTVDIEPFETTHFRLKSK